MDAKDVLDGLVQPTRLWSRAEVLARPSPVPSRPGVYGWYFKELPWPIDTSQCMTWDGCTLLYGGIAPKAPPANGRPASQPADPSNADPLPLHRQRRRLDPAAHLGCLLAERLGIQLAEWGEAGALRSPPARRGYRPTRRRARCPSCRPKQAGAFRAPPLLLTVLWKPGAVILLVIPPGTMGRHESAPARRPTRLDQRGPHPRYGVDGGGSTSNP
jgi:hypothetical protein